MTLVERFGQNLQRARRARGMTQEELEKACGVHRTHISLLERAQREPKLTTVSRLADGLEMKAGVLLRGVWSTPIS